jgi:arginase
MSDFDRPSTPPASSETPIVLLGIPLELGAGTRGAIMGPAALRTAGLAEMLRELGHVVRDAGDIPVPDPVPVALAEPDAQRCRNLFAIAGWTQAVHDRAYGLLGSEVRPVFLGGDHALSMGTISAVARRCAEQGRDLAVLWLDAHADFNTPASTPSGNMHGMSVAFITGETSLAALLGDRPAVPVPYENVHLFGLRSVDHEERRRIADAGFNAVDMRMIDENGVSVLVGRLIQDVAARGAHLHVSLDVDFLDPACAPGVGTTVAGGATEREAHLIMEMLHDSGLVRSLDVVELNPFLDERGRSARLLADLVASLFGRSVLNRTSRRGAGP